MNTLPFILVADRRTLKAFAPERTACGLRLVDAIAIPEARRRTRDSLAVETARRMESLLQAHQPDRWAFAAPADINGAILECVPPRWLSRLQENLPKDLHGTGPNALKNHFERQVA